MAYIDLYNIYKRYDSKDIFKNMNFHLKEGERVAILGVNGCGKSTLMKIAYGLENPDSGKRVIDKSVEMGFLPQQPNFNPNLTVKETIESELKELKEAQKEYKKITEMVAQNPEDKSLLKKHSQISAYLDHHSAWNLDNKVERVLQEFKLKEYEDRLIVTLSGGEQKRVALSSLILKKPDVLLLDEPTNHLDVYMVEFLEDILRRERFTLLFISHDRYFIDNIATRVVEVENFKLINYSGGYIKYLKQKEKRLSSLKREYDNLLKLLKREEEWLSRGVKARLKRDQGRKERVLELRKKAKSNPTLIRKMQIELDREKKGWKGEKVSSKRKMLFEIEDISYSIAGKSLIKNFSSRILKKDKIAVVGSNGSGKSTLLKLLLGQLKPDSGKIERGVDIKVGYFDQHREMLNSDNSLIETFCPNGGDRVLVEGKNYHVYGYLKNFLFPKEYLNKKIGELSGGEKNRVALALLFTKHYDCLILDEPTNDLDIQTINILEEKLINYQGSIIFVSHDRYFVDKLSDRLFIFKGDGKVEESFQLYSQYLEVEKEMNNLHKIQSEIDNSPQEKLQKREKEKKKSKKLSFNEKRDLEILPDKIEKIELEIEKINECLSNPNCYSEEGLNSLSQKLSNLNSDYEKLSDRYLELLEKFEEMNS